MSKIVLGRTTLYPFVNILFLLHSMFNPPGGAAQEAPISTIEDVVSSETEVQVSIHAQNFTNIGACNLRMLYDPAIMTAISVVKSPQLSGGFSTNINEPGIITLGWYASPAITLPGEPELFILTFEKVTGGTTSITWDDDGFSCAWSDGNFNYLNDIPTEDFYINGSLTFQENTAPVVFAPSLAITPLSQIDIPIRVAAFSGIGSFHLTLITDAAEMDYLSFVNTSGFPGLTVMEAPPGKVVLNASVNPGNPGISLDDDAVLVTLVFGYNENPAGLTWFDNGESCQFTDDQFTVLDDTPQTEHYIDGSIAGAVELEVTAFLEGPCQDEEMHTLLNEQGLLPHTQPYSVPPWNYPGTEFTDAPPGDAVDWVLIELREWAGEPAMATPDKTIARKAGFLMKNGAVKDLDGISNILVPVPQAEHSYLVFHHRNHLGMMSSDPLAINLGMSSCNFTTGAEKAFGGMLSQKEIAPGKWGMISGDGNADGVIDMDDKTASWNGMAGSRGYLMGDFDMNGEANNEDKNEKWLENLSRTSQVPD